MHGGKTPSVKAAAERRRAAAEAERYVEASVVDRGPLSLADVYRELLTTAGLAIAWRDLAQRKVEELASWRYTAAGAGTEQLRSEVAIFERSMDRAAKTAELIARLDLDARVQHIDERIGAQVAEVIKRTLELLGVDHEDAEVRATIARALREVVKNK